MANSREVLNPFSRNQDGFIRNTEDNGWVAVHRIDYTKRPQAWSGKTIQHNSPQTDITTSGRHKSPTHQDDHPSSSSFTTNFSTEYPPRKDSISPGYFLSHNHSLWAHCPNKSPDTHEYANPSNHARVPYSPSLSQPQPERPWWIQDRVKDRYPQTLSGKQDEERSITAPGLPDMYHSANILHESESNDERPEIWPKPLRSKEKQRAPTNAQRQQLIQADGQSHRKSRLAARHVAAEALHSLQSSPPPRPNRVNEIARQDITDSIVRKDSRLSKSKISNGSSNVPIGIDPKIVEMYANRPLPPTPVVPPASKKPYVSAFREHCESPPRERTVSTPKEQYALGPKRQCTPIPQQGFASLPQQQYTPIPNHDDASAPKKKNVSSPKTPSVRTPQRAYMTGLGSAGMVCYMIPEEDNNEDTEKQANASKRESRPFTWFKSLTDKYNARAHDAMKARISRPGPLLAGREGQAFNPTTKYVNVRTPVPIAPSPYHVDRTGGNLAYYDTMANDQAAQRRPLLNRERPGKRNSRQKPVKSNKPRTDWHDAIKSFATVSASKLTAPKFLKRKDSDASFACRGLGGSPATPSVYSPQLETFATGYPAHESLNAFGQNMVPEPLRLRKPEEGFWIYR